LDINTASITDLTNLNITRAAGAITATAAATTDVAVVMTATGADTDIEGGKNVNVASPTQICNILYKDFKFPKQHPKKKDGRGLDKTKTTADVGALLKLSLQKPHPLLDEILLHRNLTKTAQALSKGHDPDHRMRCSYNVVGTDTGRFSCAKSLTGNGDNLQTVTKLLRHLYLADDDRYFFQVDLAGADGWTVAAHCNALGDPTMLDDYLFGIKPARVIGLMYQLGPQVSSMPRAELHELSKSIGQGDTEWLYFTCKRVQHGTNYLLGIDTMIDQIMKDSYKLTGKPIRVDKKICTRLQQLYLLRYKAVKQWHGAVERKIIQTGCMQCASGHVRQFLDRREHNGTLRKACAQEPQHNTTYAIRRALLNILQAKHNRNPNGSFIVEPLHMVHDSINGQFPTNQIDFARKLLYSAFDFTLTIADQPIHIPFEGTYGPNWYDQPHEL
jgi:hypothetical protein